MNPCTTTTSSTSSREGRPHPLTGMELQPAPMQSESLVGLLLAAGTASDASNGSRLSKELPSLLLPPLIPPRLRSPQEPLFDLAGILEEALSLVDEDLEDPLQQQ